ncbi:hypothetical protein GCM10009678_37940 [Actinomadura kijaniata]
MHRMDPDERPAARHRGPRRQRRHLNRLARALRRRGWRVERRFGTHPPLLHVYASEAPSVGESVLVADGPTAPWFRSSTGAYLAPCSDPARAIEAVTDQLTPWVAAALTPAR